MLPDDKGLKDQKDISLVIRKIFMYGALRVCECIICVVLHIFFLPEALFLQCLHSNGVIPLIVGLQTVQAFL